MNSSMHQDLFADFYVYFGNAHSSKQKGHICIPCKDEAILAKRRLRRAEGGEFLYLIRNMGNLEEKFLQIPKVHVKQENFSKYLKIHSQDLHQTNRSEGAKPNAKCNTNLKVNSETAPKLKVSKKPYAKNAGAKAESKENTRNGVGITPFKALVGKMMEKYMESVIDNIEMVYCDVSESRKKRKIRSMSMLDQEYESTVTSVNHQCQWSVNHSNCSARRDIT